MKCSAIKVILLAPVFCMLKATKAYANFVERVENRFCLPNDLKFQFVTSKSSVRNGPNSTFYSDKLNLIITQ